MEHLSIAAAGYNDGYVRFYSIKDFSSLGAVFLENKEQNFGGKDHF